MRFKAVTLGIVLAGTALGSSALSLGRARGVAWIGQPLELLVPVQVDPGQADGSLCAEADVFHGDSRQDASRVQVQVMPSEQPDTFNLKISSSALIDEPVVTVYLRAGCNPKSSRKFVLLADFPGDAAAPLSRTAPPAISQPPLVIPFEASGTATSSSPSVPRAATDTAMPTKSAAKSDKTSVPSNPGAPKEVVKAPPKEAAKSAPKVPAASKDNIAKAEKPVAAAAASAPGKPRLRLDPLDTLSERVKTLEASTTAAAPQDAASAAEGQRLQALQTDLKTLLDQAVKNEASLQAMRERLEKAEAERVPVGVVYGLGALVALCLGALAVLWTRRAKQPAWEQPSVPGLASAVPGTAAALHTEREDAAAQKDVDVDMVDLDDDSFDQLMGQPATDKKTALSRAIEAGASGSAVPQNFHADTLVDLRQQAEFLARLGRVDEAIEVLGDAMHGSDQDNPLLFLDMLGLTHTHDRPVEFGQCRAEFARQFNVSVPDFAHFKDEGRSLDAYPALLDHINSQWESPHIADVIQACLVRNPAESDPMVFDLAAFRELLTMHSTARQHRTAKV